MTAGITFSQISDHFPYFINVSNIFEGNNKRCNRFVKSTIDTQEARVKLLDELQNKNLPSHIDSQPYASPNINYKVLMQEILVSKDKHLPYKYVKFDKHKHKDKKWITFGIIKSIKYRDELYIKIKKYKGDDSHLNHLITHLNTYNFLLRKTIRDANLKYYEQQFLQHKQDIKKTWGIISEILSKKNNRKNIGKLTVNGKQLTDPAAIVEHFNSFFHKHWTILKY